jgi:hypothetical protein
LVVPVLLALVGAGAAGAEALLSISPRDDVLRTIDSRDGSTLDASVTLALGGRTVLGGKGLAKNPQSGALYALLRLDGFQFPEPVTLDEWSGLATSVGNTSDDFAGISFAANGTLYAVSGDGGLCRSGSTF